MQERANAKVFSELKTAQAGRRLSMGELDDENNIKGPNIDLHLKTLSSSSNNGSQYIFSVGDQDRVAQIHKYSGELLDKIFSQEAFDIEESIKKVQ